MKLCVFNLYLGVNFLYAFRKWFSCADCKYITYTTCCPKAYAQHRSPILFGKKMAKTLQEFEGTLQRNILLPESWYCSCGYSSAEGNKLGVLLACLIIISDFNVFNYGTIIIPVLHLKEQFSTVKHSVSL